MITFPRLSKPRQKINLLIAALFVAVQLPLMFLVVSDATAQGNKPDTPPGLVENNEETEDTDEDHCENHNGHPNKIENKTGDITVNGVKISWSGDPGVITFNNTNNVQATITWCAKGGENFSDANKATGTVVTNVAANDDAVINNLGTEISYFIHYSVTLEQQKTPKDPTALAELLSCVPNSGETDDVKVTVTNTDDETNEPVDYTVTLNSVNKSIPGLVDGSSASVTYTSLAVGAYSATVTGSDKTTATSNSVTVKNCPATTVIIEDDGEVLGDTDEVVTTGGQGAGVVLGAQTEAPVGGVSAGFGGAAAGTSLSSLAGLATSLSAVGYGVASLRKRQ